MDSSTNAPLAPGRRRPRPAGQAALEYILLLSTIVGVYVALSKTLGRLEITEKFADRFKNQYARVYRYGRDRCYEDLAPVKGPEDPGGAHCHVRAIQPAGNYNFRLFITKTQ